MNDCIIEFNGKLYTAATFDEYLYSQILNNNIDINNIKKNISAIFSTKAPLEELSGKMEVIKENFKTHKIVDGEDYIQSDVDSFNKKHTVKNSIGVTTLIHTAGNINDINIPIINKYNPEKNFNELLNKCKKIWDDSESVKEEWNPYTIDGENKIKKIVENYNKTSIKNGNDIHKIIEVVLSSWNKDTGIDEKLLEQNLLTIRLENIGNVNNTNTITYKDAIKNDSTKKILNSIVTIGKEIVNQIASKVKDLEMILPEYSIISKPEGINTDLLNAVKSNEDSWYKDCDSINARMDIVAFDKNGNAYIFDIKTSSSLPKSIDDSSTSEHWSKAKEQATFAQLKLEERILEQYHINTRGKYVIPIKINYEFEDNVYGLKYNPSIKNITVSKNNVLMPLNNLDFPEINSAINIILPISSSIDLLEIDKLNDLIIKLFPDIAWAESVTKEKEKEIEIYRNKVKLVTNVDGSKYWVFYANNLLSEYKGIKPREEVKATSEKELEEKLSIYVDGIKETHSSQLLELSKQILNTIESKNPKNLEELYQKYNYSPSFAKRMQKYFNDGWSLLKNEVYNQNGIFFFVRGDRIEIVQVTNMYLTYQHRLSKGTSILGRWLEDRDVDNRKIYSAFTGNLLLMKLAIMIAHNSEIIPPNTKITQLRVLHPLHGTEFSATEDEIVYNYNTLCDNYHIYEKDDNFKRLSSDSNSLFWKTPIAVASIASDIATASEINIGNNGKFTLKSDDLDTAISKLEEMMTKLEKRYPDLRNRENYDRLDPDILKTYGELGKALLWLKGKHSVKIETDKGKYKDKYFSPGLWILPLADSTSANVREFASLLDSYRNSAVSYFTEISYQWQELLVDVYKEANHDKWTGGEKWLIFRKWLRKDNSGNIDKRFLIRNFMDPFWDDKPCAKKAAQFMLDKFFEFKYKNVNEYVKLRDYNDENIYYQVPIVEAGLFDRLISKKDRGYKNISEFSSDMKNTIKQKIEEIGNVYTDFFAGTQDHDDSPRLTDETRLPNKYLDLTQERRADLLEQRGLDFAEKDLDVVFSLVTSAAARSQAMEKHHLLFSAFFVNLHLLNNNVRLGKNSKDNMKNIIEALNKFFSNRVLHLPIMDESLLSTYKLLSVIKTAVSTLTIAFSPAILARELFTSGYRMFSRTSAHLLEVDPKIYAENVNWIISNCYKNTSNFTLVNQINKRFSMANYGMDEMGSANRLSFWGLGNINKEVGFEVTKMGDFLYRNAYLWSLFELHGCKDAYVLDYSDPHAPNGLVVYDMHKDKRFSDAIITNNKVTWNQNSKTWELQAEEYNRLVNQFIEEGREIIDPITKNKRLITFGDVLPDAFTLKQIASARNEADLMLGHFDNETKSLIFNTFLGGIMLQYKTYLSSLFEQAFSVAHKINVYETVKHKNNEGKQLYRIFSVSKEEIEKYGFYRLATEDDPELQEILESEKNLPINKRRAEKWITEEAITIEGTVVKFFEFLKALFTLDQEELNKLWKSPKARGLISMFLLDNFGLMLLGGFFDLIFGVKNPTWKDAYWFKRWSYSVLWGMTQDGPTLSILNGLVGGFNPPAVMTIKKMISDFGSVVTGNSNTLYAIFHSIGATRELATLLRTS